MLFETYMMFFSAFSYIIALINLAYIIVPIKALKTSK